MGGLMQAYRPSDYAYLPGGPESPRHPLCVLVYLQDDDGERIALHATGETVDEAVAAAEAHLGGTFAMDEWEAA